MLKDESRETRAIKTRSGSGTALNAVNVAILSAMNRFWPDYKKRVMVTGL